MVKDESCNTCRHCIDGLCWNGNSVMYLERVRLNGGCSSGWRGKQ